MAVKLTHALQKDITPHNSYTEWTGWKPHEAFHPQKGPDCNHVTVCQRLGFLHKRFPLLQLSAGNQVAISEMEIGRADFCPRGFLFPPRIPPQRRVK